MAAAFVGVPLMSIVLMVSSLGDCDPGAYCKHGIILGLFLPALIITGTVGFVTRLVINWFANRRSNGS